MTPAQSDLALLEVARRCDFYGVKLHAARDADDVPGHLTVLHLGIKVRKEFQITVPRSISNYSVCRLSPGEKSANSVLNGKNYS